MLGFVGMALAVCLANCAGPASKPSPPYRLSTSAVVVLHDVRVSGTTDMPDGGIVTIYAWSDTDEPDREWTGHATVRAGSFSGLVPMATWQAATVHLSVGILGDRNQPAEVLAVIGLDGALLSGPDVQVGEDDSRIIENRLDIDRDASSPR
jgi:hypothetical protein